MKKLFTEIILILLILLLGFLIRIYKVNANPPGFFCDEAAIGYNAYSLLKTGIDEYGKSFPFFFRSFGDYRNPVPIYLMIPSIAVLGLNEFSIRLTSVIAGSLTILFLYLIGEKLFNPRVGLISAFFLAISPWHIHFSRFGSEYIFFPFLFSLAFFVFLIGLKKRGYLILASFLFGTTLYTYYPAWLVVPLFIIGLVFIYRQTLFKDKKFFITFLVIFLLALTPLYLGFKKGTAITRWNRVSVFKHSSDRNYRELTKGMFDTYIAHFSYNFLLEKGDIDYPGHFITRFSSRGTGELYFFQLPLLILWVFPFFRNRKNPGYQSLLLMLMLYPLGSTFIGTDGGGPFAFRSIFGVIPFQIITAAALAWIAFKLGLMKPPCPWEGELSLGSKKDLGGSASSFPASSSSMEGRGFRRNGIKRQWSKLIKIVLGFIFIIAVLFSLTKYLYNYHFNYPLYSSDFWGWQFGPREVMKYFLSAKDRYDDLFMMGDFNSPEIFIKFYDPKNLCLNHCQIGGLERLDFKRKQLYAIGENRIKEIPSKLNFIIKEKIIYPNGMPAFYLGEIYPR